jgi:Cu/Ag efflux pump CusA
VVFSAAIICGTIRGDMDSYGCFGAAMELIPTMSTAAPIPSRRSAIMRTLVPVIPVAVFGAVFGHYLMGSPVTFVSLLVCIALTGIVVNDSLVLLDRVRRLRADGLSPTEAATLAAANRLRAILIGSITTMAGVTPLMLATNENVMVLVPGAITLCFGLAFGTLVVLVLHPTGYLVMEDMARGLRWLRTGDPDLCNCPNRV